MQAKIIWLALLNIVTLVLLCALWEFGLENRICEMLGMPNMEPVKINIAKFILVSILFASVSMLIPGIMINNLIGRIKNSESNALRLSETDELTGAKNRRSFNMELKNCKKKLIKYSVTLIDVNDFKIINDLNGHHKGDDVLVALAKLLEESISLDEHFYRIGGDEFAIISTSKEPEAIVEIAEKIYQRSKKFQISKDSFLTISIGVAFSDKCGETDIVVAADLAMYEAKRNKNIIVAQYSPILERKDEQIFFRK